MAAARLRRRTGEKLSTWTPGTATRPPATAARTSSTPPAREPDRDHRRRARRTGPDLLRDFRDPDSKILGSEFVGTSISTTGDGSDAQNTARVHREPVDQVQQPAPRLRARALDQQLCRTDYRTLQYVKRPGAPVTTHKSFVVEAGNPGLKDA